MSFDKQHLKKLSYDRRLWGWLLVLPTFICILLVAGWPLLRTIWLSFTDTSLASLGQGGHFIGLANYIKSFHDDMWWTSVKNTMVFTLATVSLETVFGLMIALFLQQKFPGRGIVRALVLVPWAIPTVISAKIWAWMLNDMFGVINALLLKAHLISEPLAWLANPQLSMVSIILVDVWKTTPFMTLLIMAGLQSIPAEIWEASLLQVPSRWQRFYHITLPLIQKPLTVAIIFRCLDALRVFDQIYVLTGTRSATSSMAIYSRLQMVDFQDFGYGSTLSTLTFFIIALFIIIYFKGAKIIQNQGEAA
ncbi:MAG: sugar ABC transporter permease [Bdellovibrionales bacterium]|nr:sugar ABC transporter permease [Bdellovibrionales bacterium]